MAAVKGLLIPLEVRLLTTDGGGSDETADVLVARFFFGVTRGLLEAADVADALARNAAAPDSPFDNLSGVRDPLMPPALGLGCLLICAGAAFDFAGGVGASFLRRAGLLVFARAAAAAGRGAEAAALAFAFPPLP